MSDASSEDRPEPAPVPDPGPALTGSDPALSGQRPIVCAHRGASLRLPDNSIEAFEAAIASRCEMIETDIRADRHGRPVLSHDRLRGAASEPRADRPRGLRVPPRSRASPPRARPPVALDSLLELSAGRIGLDLEIKEARVVPALLDAIAGWEGPLLLTSFDPRAIRIVRERAPTLQTGLIAGPMHIRDPLARAQSREARALVVSERRLTTKVLSAPSLPIWVWTVNRPARLARWLSEPRLACVITDDPDTAVALRDDLGPRPTSPDLR